MTQQNRIALVVLAACQALVLLLLQQAISHEVWPATQPQWLHALYTVAVGLPLFLYLGAIHWQDKTNSVAAGILGALLFWLGWHNGWLSAPLLETIDTYYYGGIPPLGFSLFLALFILGFYFRTWRECGQLDYSSLLDNAWRNALSLAFLGLFIGVFWLLLLLWALLFDVINIDFFLELFQKPAFIYPITGLVGGLGLGLIRDSENMVSTVRRLCETLTRALLPLSSLILILFLGALPFTGIRVLWETGHASVLMLCLATVILYFFNAAAAEHKQPFSHSFWLRRLFSLSLVLTPITVLLAGWSLGLRIDQYGLTVSRSWALFIGTFIALYSFTYTALIVWHRGLAIAHLRQCNIILGIALALSLILAHTPLLDFHRLAANNQLARLENGNTQAEDFDALYLRFGLGTYGVNLLEKLRDSELAATNDKLQHRIEHALSATHPLQQRLPAQQDDIDWRRQQFQLLPGTLVEDEFLSALQRESLAATFCLNGEAHCVLGDFQRNGIRYRATTSTYTYYLEMPAWQWRNEQWQEIGTARRITCNDTPDVNLEQPFSVLESEFFLFGNGTCLYQLLPSEAFILSTSWPQFIQ